MGLLDSFDDYLLEYGLPTVIGAGVGGLAGLAGGPAGILAGATIGGGSALAGAIAGPKVAEALPEGTPGSLRTLTEYGIYGLSGGPAIAGAMAARGGARIALQAALSKAAAREGAKLAVGSGFGAVAGGQAARAFGAPEWLGELAGGVVGPFAPGIGRRIGADFAHNRALAYQTGNPRWQGLARAVGANESNSAAARRTPPLSRDSQEIYGSSKNSATRALDTAAALRARTPDIKDRVDDDTVRAIAGLPETVLNPRAYLLARAKNQLPPEMAEAGPAMTKELRVGKRRLATLYKQLANARTADNEAQALVAQLGPGELLPVGDPSNPSAWFWRAADGTETLLPEARVAGYTGPTVANVRNATKTHASRERIERSLKTLLGLDAPLAPIPTPAPVVSDVLSRYRQNPRRVSLADLEAESRRLAGMHDPGSTIGPAGDFRGLRTTKERLARLIERRLELVESDPWPTPSDRLVIPGQYGQRVSTEIPEDPDAALDLLRRRVLGEDMALVDASLMPQEQAIEAARLVISQDAERKAVATLRRAALEDNAADHQLLGEFLQNNPKYGALPFDEGLMRQATDDLRAIYHQEDRLKALGAAKRRFMDVPVEGTLTYDEYLQLVDYIGRAQPTAARVSEVVASFIENPRGSVWVQTGPDLIEPKTLVGIDPATNMALVRSTFQSVTQADSVPRSSLRVRFTPEQQSVLQKELLAAQRIGGGSRAKLPKLQTASTQRIWATRKDYEQAARRATDAEKPLPQADGFLDEELASAWQRFESNFIPPGNTIEFRAATPQDLDQQITGWREIQRAHPAGATPESRAATVTFQREIREHSDAFDEVNFPVEMRDVLGEGGLGWLKAGEVLDVYKPYVRLSQQTSNNVVNMVRKERTGYGGSLGQIMERTGVGKVVTEPRAAAAHEFFINSAETVGVWVSGTYNALRSSLAQSTLHKAGVTSGITRGRISKEGQFQQRLASSFEPDKLPKELKARYDALDEAAKPVVDALLPTYLRAVFGSDLFTGFDAAFPTLANVPDFMAAKLAYSKLDEAVNKAVLIEGVSGQTHARRFSMLVSEKYRQFLNPDVLSPKKGATPNFFDVFDSVWTGAKTNGPAAGVADRVRRAFVHGQDADNAWVVAAFTSIATRKLENKMKALAKIDPSTGKPFEITLDDLRMGEGNWIIKNANKWEPEVYKSLKGIVDINNGRNQWGGLAQVSQQIALGNLALDLSVVGIQGYKVAAQTLLAGRPFTAARLLKTGLTHITTDYGYNSFLRQNLDEIMYYTQNGLLGGLRGQIAGPNLTKAPLEHLPYIGKVFGAAFGLSDIQYGRAVFYWKIQGIRENLDWIRTMQAAYGKAQTRFLGDVIEASPVLKGVAADAGGLEAFMLQTDEETVRSVIRQVNRSMSSVNLTAEGVGPVRQAFEQITTIVPGFFRGQIGQWAAIITKPTSLEGHLALSMLAREYMFGGMVAMGMARMLGTEERINWDDMTSATWLGVPVPDEMGGGTINLLPTMSIPRLASRVVRESVEAAAEGEAFDPLQPIEAFAHGRMSPMAGALYDNISGKDFLGRRYDSQLEKWGFTLSSSVLPIVMQSAIEDSVESLKQNAATGQLNWRDLATSTGLEIFGKGLIPTHPIDQLNTIAVSAFETDWSLLTDAEKDQLRRSNPAVAVAEAEYDYWGSRRADNREAHIDAAYKKYEENIEETWNEPIMYDGIRSTQVEDDARVVAGSMTGDTWRERYHVRQRTASQWYDALLQRLELEGVNPDEVREKRLERLTENRPEDRAVLLQLAKAEYSGLDPETILRTVATPTGEVTTEVVDWDAFFARREEVLAKYPADIRTAVQRSSRADELPGLAAYQQASQAQRDIEALGRYRGLSAEQGDKLDRMRSVVTRVGDAIRGQAGAAPGGIPQQIVQQAALQEMITNGIVTGEADMMLFTLAMTMARDSRLADAMRNPAQISAVLNNPMAVVFFPYLRHRVPREFWPQLPEQIFQAELVEAQLGAF